MSTPGVLGVLGGMGPLATIDFLHKVLAATPARTDQEHIPVIASSITTNSSLSSRITHGVSG